MNSRRAGRRRWLWLLPVLLLVLLLALASGLLAVLASDSGSTWLLRQASGLVRSHGIEVAFVRSRGNLLRRLELEGLDLVVGDTRIAARQLVLQWRPRALFEHRLHLEQIEVDGLRVTPPPTDADEPAPPQLPELALPLEIQLDRLRLADAAIVQPDGPVAVDEVVLAATLDRQGLRIGDLHLAATGARLDGDIGLQTMTPHALHGRLSAQIDESLSGPDIGPLAAQMTLAGSALRPRFDLALQAPAVLRLQGTLQLDRPQPGFELAATWETLHWPLHGQPSLTSQSGTLELQGIPDDYRLTLQTGLQAPDMPPGELRLQARGGRQGLVLAPATLAVRDGRLHVEGEVRWEAGTQWLLDARLERLDPGLFFAEWPGEITGRVSVEGGLGVEADDALRLHAQVDELGGTLRGYPVSARGGLDWRAGKLLAQGLQLASGPNRVVLDGRADERLDLGIEIDAPELASLYPGLSGRLQGHGRLSGTPALPVVAGQLSGGELAYREMRVQDLQLEVDWRGDGGESRLRAAGLASGAAVLDSVRADLVGGPDAHRLGLVAEGPEGGVRLQAAGGLHDQVWEGTLQDLALAAPGLGEWRLQAPAAMVLGAARARSDRLCLRQEEATFCTGGGWDSATGLDLAGGLNGFALARVEPYLAAGTKVEGRLAADFSVTGSADNPAIAFELRPGDGRIRLEDAVEPLELAFRDARVKGRFADDRGSAELGLTLGTNGHAAGRLTLGPEQDGQRALGGEVSALFPDLALVAGFVPALDEVQGRLEANLALAGTLDRPQLRGGVHVVGARARLTAAGVLLTDIDVAVRGDGDGPLRVEGKIHSGEGRIVLDGQVDPATADVDLTIRGEAFQAVQLPEAQVLVSPDLRLTGGRPYRLSGVLRIPSAAIELEELPTGTVGLSDDEIVVGDEPVQAPAPSARNLAARVRIELGDAVSFEGFGLTTRLVGALDASVDERGTLVDGKIELRDGRYEAYGQDLTVERGRLVFAGPPGNPDVDLRALRLSRDGEVKAYLSLVGPLSKPRARVYSEPTLPEAEALAYLVTGRGLDQAGANEGANIAGAALSLGLAKGEPLLQDMSDRLGLDDLRIEGGADGLADSSVVVGKYLNPDLYLGYSQGLFNPEGAFLLRLRLTERLEVETRSGTQQSVDVFYRIEHD